MSKRKLEVGSGQRKILNFFGQQRKIGPEQSVSDEATSSHTEPASTSGDDIVSKPQKASRTYDKHFIHEWLTPKYPQYSSWLAFDSEKQQMFCSLCIKQKKDNALTRGTDNFRTSTLQRHLESVDHRDAAQEEAFKKDFKTACEKLLSGKDAGVKTFMMVAYWLVKEEMPVSKFSKLIMLLRLAKCPDIESMNVGENATYMSDTAAYEMIDCIAEVVRKQTMNKVQSSPTISILTDESTDLTVDKKLVLYARVLDPQTFQPCTVFLTNIHINDGTAKTISEELVTYLSAKGVCMKKVSGFGSDGASVMTGKKVGLQLC